MTFCTVAVPKDAFLDASNDLLDERMVYSGP